MYLLFIQNISQDCNKIYNSIVDCENRLCINDKEVENIKKYILHLYNLLFKYSSISFTKQNFGFCWNDCLDIPNISNKQKLTLYSLYPNKKLKYPQLINHFPYLTKIIHVSNLIHRLYSYYKLQRLYIFSFLLPTYFLSNKNDDDRKALINEYERNKYEMDYYHFYVLPTKFCKENKWLIKYNKTNKIDNDIKSILKYISNKKHINKYFLYIQFYCTKIY